MLFSTSVVNVFLQNAKGVQEQAELNLDKNGVIGDKFYSKNLNRSVLLTSVQSYEKAKEQGIELSYGDLGENILLELNPCELKEGTLLQAKDLILEITQPCTLCKSLSCIDKKLPKLLRDDRGIFAKVIKSGKIRANTKIFSIEK